MTGQIDQFLSVVDRVSYRFVALGTIADSILGKIVPKKTASAIACDGYIHCSYSWGAQCACYNVMGGAFHDVHKKFYDKMKDLPNSPCNCSRLLGCYFFDSYPGPC